MPLPFLARKKPKEQEDKKWAIVLFELVQDGMEAEEALKAAGFECRVVGPPPEVRIGCDLALLIDAQQQVGVERIIHDLEIPYIDIVFPKIVDLRRLYLTKEVDFGRWMMVRCGNVKITYDKETLVIVNVSGGAGSDVPNITQNLLGKTLQEAPPPRTFGFTLCAYSAERAFRRCLEIVKGG
jgi:Putative Se/S carrier protein-like